MNMWILICAIELIVFALIIKWLLKEKNVTAIINKRLGNVVDGNRLEMQKQTYKAEMLQLSLKNAHNAHEFINQYIQSSKLRHPYHINIYQKELSYLGASQVAYVVFYEDDYIYKMEYLNDTNVEFDITKHVSRLELNCMMFIDGVKIDPALIEHIAPDDNTAKIEELNMGHHQGKGAGSFYLECLSKELLRYPRIQYIRGGLSSVDFKERDKLIHFYDKNGFEKIKAMTETSWGHVTKTIRSIDDDVLKT